MRGKFRKARNLFFQGMVIFLSLVAITPIILIIFDLIQKGYKQINFNFFTKIAPDTWDAMTRSEEHTSELQSHSFISYAVFCLKKKTKINI